MNKDQRHKIVILLVDKYRQWTDEEKDCFIFDRLYDEIVAHDDEKLLDKLLHMCYDHKGVDNEYY